MRLKKLYLIILLILTLSALNAESFFSNYDFTFYKTVLESLNIMDDNSIGFDYTGFGFIGNRNTSGLIVRLGIQAPYTTLENIFIKDDSATTTPETNEDSESKNPALTVSYLTSNPTLEAAKTSTNEKYEFIFTLMIGPAVHYIINPQLDAYAGIGLKLREHITTEGSLNSRDSITSYDTAITADFDLGFKINLETHTSIRFGLYGTYDVVSYLYTSYPETSEEKSISSTSNLHINLIAFGEFRAPLTATGYISMGKTFSSLIKDKKYKYEITGRTLGKGELIEIGSPEDKEKAKNKLQYSSSI